MVCKIEKKNEVQKNIQIRETMGMIIVFQVICCFINTSVAVAFYCYPSFQEDNSHGQLIVQGDEWSPHSQWHFKNNERRIQLELEHEHAYDFVLALLQKSHVA